jgi:predicted permease
MLSDLRYAARQLARTPGLTAVAILTLALGIGANTGLFSLATAVLMRPLPEVRDSERLVWFAPVSQLGGGGRMLSYPDFADFRDQAGVFSEAAAMGDVRFSISSNGEPTLVRGQLVSGSFFSMLHVRMTLGRGFSPEEDRTPRTHPVAVISHRLWRERFDGDPAVLDRPIVLNGTTYRIVGVAPERFNGVDAGEWRDVWVPMMMARIDIPGRQPILQDRGSWWLMAVGRLKPGITVAQADAAVRGVAARHVAVDSANYQGLTATVMPVTNGLGLVGGSDIAPIAALAWAVTALVLLVACANVSNMLLSRAAARRREIAVRLSLGAARPRLLRQLLTESLLLASLATLLGFVLSLWATEVMASIIPVPIDIAPDLRVLGFTTLAAVTTTLLFGTVPALHATRGDVWQALRSATIGFDRRRSRLQSSFVVAQLSLSIVLLVMAGMFISGMYKANRTEVHFDANEHVLAASFDLGLQGYDADRAQVFIAQLQERARALPGVESVSLTNQVPMGERLISGEVAVESADGKIDESRFGERAGLEIYYGTISTGYFGTLGIPMAAGRDFATTDAVGTPPVAIVSEDFARQAWPGQNPIGKRIRVDGGNTSLTPVVGVARQALTMGLGERARPIIYLAQRQRPRVLDLTLLVRSRGNAGLLAGDVRRIIRELDKNLPVVGVQTLAQYRRDRGAETRLGSTLLGIFGALALLLATVGMYAVMAFSVSQRTREIGLRVALGAANRQIASLFLGEGLRLAGIGIIVGLALSAIAARLLASLFLGVRATDAIVFGGVAFLLAVVALAASLVPARRASRVDPMTALRHE